jgi:hypothetical protein
MNRGLVGLAGALIVLGSAAAPASVSAVPAQIRHGDQFRVSGQGVLDPVSNVGSMVRDRRGGEHVLSIHGTDGSAAHAVYRTRRPGATHWTSQNAGAVDPGGRISVATALSSDGKRVDVFVADCAGVLSAQTSVGSTHLPTMHRLVHHECSDDTNHPFFVGAAVLPHHRATVLMERTSGQATETIRLLTGAPGRHFHEVASLPGSGTGYTPRAISRDPVTGQLLVLATGRGTASAPPAGTYVWSRNPGAPWTGPRKIPASAGVFASLSVYDGRVAVGEYRVHFTPTYRSVAVVTLRSAGGHWSASKQLPQSSDQANGLILNVNPASGHLHATWGRFRFGTCGVGCSGIVTVRFVNGHWSTARRLTHSQNDIPSAVTFDSQGRVVVGYVRST